MGYVPIFSSSPLKHLMFEAIMLYKDQIETCNTTVSSRIPPNRYTSNPWKKEYVLSQYTVVNQLRWPCHATGRPIFHRTQVQSAAQSALALALGVPSEALRQEAQRVPARQPGRAMTIMSNVIQKQFQTTITRWWFHFFFNVHPFVGEMIQFD